MDAQERARATMDKWHAEANRVGMRSLDPEYIRRLKQDSEFTKIYADFMCEHVAEQIRQAEQAAREKAAEVAKAHGPLISGSPGPLFDAGWNAACDAIEEALRALKDKP